MLVLDPGHLYIPQILDSEGLDYTPDPIQFVKRMGERYPGNMSTQPGTITQELIRICIDRTKYVDNQIKHPLNQYALESMRDAIYYFEQRASEVHKRPFFLGWTDRQIIETFPTGKNGHLLIGAGR